MPKSFQKEVTDEQFDEMWSDSEEMSVHMQAVVEAIAEERSPLEKLKENLPMLYTARGNIIKRKTLAVTTKNWKEVRNRIDMLNERGNMLELDGSGWVLTLDIATSDALREHEQVEALYLAGWNISAL